MRMAASELARQRFLKSPLISSASEFAGVVGRLMSYSPDLESSPRARWIAICRPAGPCLESGPPLGCAPDHCLGGHAIELFPRWERGQCGGAHFRWAPSLPTVPRGARRAQGRGGTGPVAGRSWLPPRSHGPGCRSSVEPGSTAAIRRGSGPLAAALSPRRAPPRSRLHAPEARFPTCSPRPHAEASLRMSPWPGAPASRPVLPIHRWLRRRVPRQAGNPIRWCPSCSKQYRVITIL